VNTLVTSKRFSGKFENRLRSLLTEPVGIFSKQPIYLRTVKIKL